MANLTFAQIRALWIQVGGSVAIADTMAAIAMAESRGGDPNAINPESCRAASHACESCTLSNTGDYSIGLWQINYYGANFAPRKARYGCPGELYDPLKNARAALDLAGTGSGLHNWTTYTHGEYRAFLPAGSGGTPPPAGTRGPTAGTSSRGAPHTIPTVTGPVGIAGEPKHLPEAWHKITDALGKTLPTRTKFANEVSRKFKQAVR